MVQRFSWVLLEALGIFLGFDFFPPFYHPCHLKSTVPPMGKRLFFMVPCNPSTYSKYPFPLPPSQNSYTARSNRFWSRLHVVVRGFCQLPVLFHLCLIQNKAHDFKRWRLSSFIFFSYRSLPY